MLHLKNPEFTFTVDDSEIGRGLNDALHLMQMERNGYDGETSEADASSDIKKTRELPDGSIIVVSDSVGESATKE